MLLPPAPIASVPTAAPPMLPQERPDRLCLLSGPELGRTLDRLASQVLESVGE